MQFDPKALRSALGRFTTGVTIVTCRDDAGRPVGLTANSFSALSLDPPLVLWALRCVSPSVAAFQAASHFTVNVLAEAQVEVSRRFATATADRFSAGVWSAGLGGAPLLAGCTASFECALQSHQVAGDHVLFIGKVLALHEAALPPLVFQAGHYRLLGEIL